MKFENDEPTHREALIHALSSVGLFATEYNSGGGIMHVMLPLIDPYSNPELVATESPEVSKKVNTFLGECLEIASLSIVTGSSASNCDIGLIGEDGKGSQINWPAWKHAETLDDAVSIFLKLWKQRDRWIQAYMNGELS
jgi:hypothetical protein